MSFEINSMVPELWCSDFQDSFRFYTEILGFAVGSTGRAVATPI